MKLILFHKREAIGDGRLHGQLLAQPTFKKLCRWIWYFWVANFALLIECHGLWSLFRRNSEGRHYDFRQIVIVVLINEALSSRLGQKPQNHRGVDQNRQLFEISQRAFTCVRCDTEWHVKARLKFIFIGTASLLYFNDCLPQQLRLSAAETRKFNKPVWRNTFSTAC